MTNFKDIFVGRRILQPLFERLHRISLRGMNYGVGGITTRSGEERVVKFVKEKLNARYPNEKVIFDVGANIGQYASILAKTFSQNDKIYCFEPSKKSFNLLKTNLSQYPNIHLSQLGLGSRAENRTLFYDMAGSAWASVYQRKASHFSPDLKFEEDISITTIDSFCQEHGIKKIHFLKIDVEGFELEVLKGAATNLSNIDFIQFEFSFANYNSGTFLFDFYDLLHKFNLYRIVQNGIRKIDYDARFEIFMTTNYLAANKNLVGSPVTKSV